MKRLWPTGLAIREGCANAASGRRMAVTICAGVALVVCGVGLANALEVSSLVESEQRWIDDGAFVLVVESAPTDSGGGVAVAACDRLAQVDGIDASFAVTVTDRTAQPANAPGTHATLALASPGVYEFLGAPVPAGAGVLVPPQVADDTGLADTESTQLTIEHPGERSDRVPVTAVLVEGTVLGEQLVGAYVLPAMLSGRSSQCYVRSDAAHIDGVRTYVRTALAAADGTPAVAHPRLTENAYGLDFTTAYDSRVLRWAWAAGAAVLVSLWALLQWTRRARWAIYATFGADRRARLTMQSAEWFSLSVVGAVWGWGTAVALAIGLGADVHVSVVQVTGQLVATWCVGSLGVVAVGLAPVGTLLDALKDRT